MCCSSAANPLHIFLPVPVSNRIIPLILLPCTSFPSLLPRLVCRSHSFILSFLRLSRCFTFLSLFNFRPTLSYSPPPSSFFSPFSSFLVKSTHFLFVSSQLSFPSLLPFSRIFSASPSSFLFIPSLLAFHPSLPPFLLLGHFS